MISEMTPDEKIQHVRDFIERLREIVATADMDDDCKQALPRFHKCEERLISFLSDAGFDQDASIIATHAHHIPATYGAPLIYTIRDDVEFYCGKLNAILEDLVTPIYTPKPQPTVANAATLNAMNSRMNRPIEIFFSYAHEDEALMDDARRQLVLFDRENIIRKWHDRRIPPGTEWKGQIDSRLRHSDMILLFISPHFFESDYCYDVEMTEAMRRHDKGDVRVIPIILRPCRWHTAPFGRLQALPKDGKAITTWANRDEACLNVADGVMQVVGELLSNTK
jgi:hypothetical protein